MHILLSVMHVKKGNWKTYFFWIVLTEAVGGLSALLTRKGMEIYNETVIKPPLSPPMILFPIVWAILYALMAIAVSRTQLKGESALQEKCLLIYILQLGFNFCWSIFFFNLQKFGFAFLWLMVLWGLIIWMILTFRKVDKPAAWLLVPYLLWVTFAAYLNAGVYVLN